MAHAPAESQPGRGLHSPGDDPMRRLLIVLAVPLLLQAATPAQPPETTYPVEVERDLVYGKGGTKDMMLDLARPTGVKGPVPCIVCVHGGGWRAGSRQDLS